LPTAVLYKYDDDMMTYYLQQLGGRLA